MNPSSFLSFLNASITPLIAGNFLTAFYGILNIKTKCFVYARAGHNYPLLIRNGDIQELNGKGSILGGLTEPYCKDQTITLNSNDKIIFYTDGLTESINEDDEMFENKLLPIIGRNAGYSIDQLILNLYQGLYNHCGSESFQDDICILGIEIK